MFVPVAPPTASPSPFQDLPPPGLSVELSILSTFLWVAPCRLSVHSQSFPGCPSRIPDARLEQHPQTIHSQPAASSVCFCHISCLALRQSCPHPCLLVGDHLSFLRACPSGGFSVWLLSLWGSEYWWGRFAEVLRECRMNKTSTNYRSGPITLTFGNGSLFLQGGKWQIG